ncbi:MAG: SCO6745 family protein [Acidimicrobiales bacterium]|jgi:hypothetical protein
MGNEGGTATDPTTVRDAHDLWVLLEAVHSVTYFTPGARAAHEATGLRGFWRGYFATRAAPMGRVGAGVVVATFAGFAPSMVERAVPAVWSSVPPDQALEARRRGAGAALRAHAGGELEIDALSAVVPLLRRVVTSLELSGHPLGAANARLSWPDDPIDALWQASTVVREHRGDGHVAVLTAEELGGCTAHVLRAAADGSRGLTQPNRGYSDDEWELAAVGLHGRGLLDAGGALTGSGRRLRSHVATRTDRLAAAGWEALSSRERERLRAMLAPIAIRLGGSAVGYPNPVGAPAPATVAG